MASVRLISGITFVCMQYASSAALAQATDSNPVHKAEPSPASGLDEIVVTAQRRKENLQTVPIAIAAVNSKSLGSLGIGNTDSLQIAVPGLELNRTAFTGASPFLRGVGANTGNPGSEPPVAMYIDDVYLGSPQADVLQLANVEQVEVLKGPQGTLFGRNATGGLINVRTKRPSHDATGDARISYGRYDTIEGSVYLTGPISDTLAASITAFGSDQGDGYGRNVTRNEDIFKGWAWNVRGSVLWEPSESTTVLISADAGEHYDRREFLPAAGTVASGGARNTGKFNTFAGDAVFSRFSSKGVSVRLEQELGFANFLSISSYRKYDLHGAFDVDLSAPPIINALVTANTKNLSQEFQLQSNKDGPIKWVFGLYYFRSKASFDPKVANGIGLGPLVSTSFSDAQTLNSYAGFGEVTYEFLPKTRLTVGGRYTTDRFQLAAGPVTSASGAVVATPFGAKANFSEPTYRAILDHRLTSDVMAYVSYSRGFKSGGFNVSSPGTPSLATPNGDPPVRPEKIDAYEAGLKTQFLDDRVRFNIAAFKYKYQDLQVVNTSGNISIFVNAAAADIKGFDFDAVFTPNRRLTITLAGAVLDAKYSSFPGGPTFVPRPAVCTPAPASTGAPTGGFLRCDVDLAGKQLTRAPKFAGTIGINYVFPTEIGDFTLNGSLYHNSGFFWESDNRLRQDSYQLINGSISWRSRSERFELGVFGKNLTNKYYQAFGAENTSSYYIAPAMPRTFGISASAHF